MGMCVGIGLALVGPNKTIVCAVLFFFFFDQWMYVQLAHEVSFSIYDLPMQVLMLFIYYHNLRLANYIDNLMSYYSCVCSQNIFLYNFACLTFSKPYSMSLILIIFCYVFLMHLFYAVTNSCCWLKKKNKNCITIIANFLNIINTNE